MTDLTAAPAAGATVLVAGATSASGVATARALHAAGATVLAAATDPGRLEARLPFAHGRYAVDLADPEAVAGLAHRLHGDHGPLDGLVHLVGGWRGGGGLAGQNDADWAFLHRNLVATLRNTTRAFHADLAASTRGRLAIVSATAVDSPTASTANYAAAKAAAETWTRAVAAAFRAAQAGRKAAPEPQRSAAVVFVVKALVDDSARAADPGNPFTGHTDVADLADAVVRLFGGDAGTLNGARLPLPPAPAAP
ncbi:hypothetical protein NCCP1664_20000 [Zafaria cholistanensis]|uniref:Uncharacterized protein n=1 Tax=Zafaria cholistanensis TaxID=1682741 RepID=A0A5A7NRW5_9MICC|nr:SDR family NAD(P)-dependent oxidoreductase [Zafaria cholistanensis]GER23505.1 hypothetical protein NCCP1664_20000 [Zafaria cholistanensis]